MLLSKCNRRCRRWRSCQGLVRGSSSQHPSPKWGMWGWMRTRSEKFCKGKGDYIWSGLWRNLDAGLKGWSRTRGRWGKILFLPHPVSCTVLDREGDRESHRTLGNQENQCAWKFPFAGCILCSKVCHAWKIHFRNPLNMTARQDISSVQGAMHELRCRLSSHSGATLASLTGACASCWKTRHSPCVQLYTCIPQWRYFTSSVHWWKKHFICLPVQTSWQKLVSVSAVRGRPSAGARGWDTAHPLPRHRRGTLPPSPQTQLCLKPSTFVFFSCTGVLCCQQDGDYPINSRFRLAPYVLFALSCVAVLYKFLFSQKHVLSARSQPRTL